MPARALSSAHERGDALTEVKTVRERVLSC